MEWLKEFLGDELYSQVEAKLKGNDKVKLANLASGEYVSKSKYDDQVKKVGTANQTIKDLQETVKKFDGVDVEGLNKRIEDLQKKYDDDLKAEKLESEIKIELTNAKAKNEKAARALLDTSIIKLDETGNVVGLKEQLENIKKDNAFLFDETPIVTEVNTGGGHDNPPKPNEVLTTESAVADYYK